MIALAEEFRERAKERKSEKDKERLKASIYLAQQLNHINKIKKNGCKALKIHKPKLITVFYCSFFYNKTLISMQLITLQNTRYP
jgi:hypothetical protein